MVVSSMRNPSDVIGRAFSHAPDSLQDAARRRALFNSSVVFFNSVSAIENSRSESMGSNASKRLFLASLRPDHKGFIHITELGWLHICRQNHVSKFRGGSS